MLSVIIVWRMFKPSIDGVVTGQTISLQTESRHRAPNGEKLDEIGARLEHCPLKSHKRLVQETKVGLGPVVRYCEHSNETPGSIDGGMILDVLTDYKLLEDCLMELID
jgi:hypothetical protein